MAASSTDVRTWAAENGYEVGDVGRLPKQVVTDYEAAHRGEGGVTEADFPDPLDKTETYADPGPARGGRGRPGRSSRPRRAGRPGRAGKGWRERLKQFGGGGGGGRGSRGSLADWAEETWTDLAWLAQPLPPLSRVLQVQAPYAGVVFDDAVRGTPIDALLQPIARYSGSLRALNGLMGPPVMVAAICTQGTFVPGPDGKSMARDDSGRPIPDQRTAMMLQLLRYSLLQMAKVSDLNADRIKERTEDMAARMAGVDVLIDSIFQWLPPRPPPGPQDGPPQAWGQQPMPAQVYLYPPSPQMDNTGADPARDATVSRET